MPAVLSAPGATRQLRISRGSVRVTAAEAPATEAPAAEASLAAGTSAAEGPPIPPGLRQPGVSHESCGQSCGPSRVVTTPSATDCG